MKILIELKCPDNDVCVAISQYLLKKYSSEMESVSVVPDSEYVTEDQMEARLKEAFDDARKGRMEVLPRGNEQMDWEYPSYEQWRNRK